MHIQLLLSMSNQSKKTQKDCEKRFNLHTNKTAVGENRAKKAITNALDSPLLNDNKISANVLTVFKRKWIEFFVNTKVSCK